MRPLVAILALTVCAFAACGESDESGDGSSSSGESTTTSAVAESTTTATDVPDEDAFVEAIDADRIRHGFTDAELIQMGEDVCAAAEEDSTDPTDTRPGTSHTSAELNGIYAGTSENPFPMSEEDAAEIGYLAAEHLCPDLTAEVSAGADIMLSDGI